MLKRVGAVVLTVVMLLSMVCTFAVASAAGDVAALQVTADKATVKRGETVAFTVKLSKAVELTGLIIEVKPISGLTLKGDPAFTVKNPQIEGNKYGWASATPLAFTDGKIATFTYTVGNTATLGAATFEVVVHEASDNTAGIGVQDVTITKGSARITIECAHDYSGVNAIAPTNVTEANHTSAKHSYACKYGCGTLKYEACSFKPTSATKHTATVDGVEVFACSVCNASYKKITPAGHTDIVLIYDAATSKKDGKWIEHCTICDQDVKTTPITYGHPGKDVTSTKKYYYNYAQYAKASGLMVGDDKGNFNPDKNIKRGEFASVLARIYYGDASKIPTFKNAQLTLTDIKGKWYRHAAQAMYNEGIISGYEQKNGTFKFKGDDPITREAVVSLFHRLYKKMHKDAPIKFAAAGSVVDMNKVSSWAKADVQWSLNTGLVVGDATTKKFNPKSNIKRRDMAVILTKYDIAIRNVKTDDI